MAHSDPQQSLGNMVVLHWQVHPGTGPYLLLVHGFLMGPNQWHPNLDALGRVCRPVVVDLLGHGRSPAPAEAERYQPGAYVEAFEAIRQALGAERWLLCGYSLGAGLTMRYALLHPQRVIGHAFTNSTSALADAEQVALWRAEGEASAARILAGGRKAIERIPVHPRFAKRIDPASRDLVMADATRLKPQGVANAIRYTTPEASVRSDWHPYPTVHDPEAWGSIPGAVRNHLLEAGDSRLNFAWPLLPATLFLDYSRTGARTPYQIPYYERRYALADLVLAECVQGQGRYLDDIVNGIWVICEETYWGVPAHVWVQAAGNTLPDRREPTVDLFAAETAALLAWSHYLLNDTLDTVSPLVRPRMEQEIRERILKVNRTRSDFPWQGNLGNRRVNNWNPWICSNWLTCILALETDDRQRAADIFLLLQTVDRFIDPYPADGGCDEGPNYWGRAGASLYENLELLYGATAGQIDVFQESLIQEVGKFIYRAHIAEDYYLNFADASALVEPEALLVYLFGQRIGDPVMQAYGTWLTDRQQILTHGLTEGEGVRKQSSLGRALPALFALTEVAAQTGTAPLLRDVWLPEIEVMSSRDQEGSAAGFYVAMKGGHNAESHNHNDIGNFVVYRDGLPLLVDAGVEEYTAKTFGPNRYDIWTMQSALS